MTGKFRSLLTMLCMLMAFMLCGTAMAEESGMCGESATWTYDEATATLTISGTGEMYDYYDYYELPWNDFKLNVKELVISDGITRIGSYAFHELSALTSLTIPGSVEVIGNHAFELCEKLEEVNFSEGLRSIGADAFWWCNGFTSIDIPASITSISKDSFNGCFSLEEINVAEGNENYCSIDGVVFSKDMKELLMYPVAKKNERYNVPETVTVIGESAFWSNEFIKEVFIFEGVTEICDSAFAYCTALEAVDMPVSLEEIDGWAFMNCEKLNWAMLPENLRTIGDGAFSNCDDLEYIEIPANTTQIGEGVFADCDSLETLSVEYGNEVFTTYRWALYSYDRTTLYCYPAGLPYTTTELHEDTTEIAVSAFSGCDNLVTVELNDGLKEIDRDAFYDCKNLKYITIPDSVEKIGYYAFDSCASLEEITMPAGVEELSDDMFWYCDSLTVANVPCAWKSEEHALHDFTFDSRVPVENRKYTHTISEAVVEDENKISFTCDACGEGDSVTLEAPTAATYTGKPIKPTVTTENNSAVVLDFASSDAYLICGMPVNAGNYSAFVRLAGENIRVDYEIAPVHSEPLGEFAGKVTIEKLTDSTGAVLVITPEDGYEIPVMTMYAVLYDEYGDVLDVTMVTCTPDELTGVLTVPWEAPETDEGESYRLMLWDAESAPAIKAE